MKDEKRKASVGDQVTLNSNGIPATVVDVDKDGLLTLVCHNGPHCNWQEYSGYHYHPEAVTLTVFADQEEPICARLWHFEREG